MASGHYAPHDCTCPRCALFSHWEIRLSYDREDGINIKEEIYTIPVMDGFHEDCECPFCAMRRKLETDTVSFVLSPSYMEEDVRGETNALGFCHHHMDQLYSQANALGLALMLHSHLREQEKELFSLLEKQDSSKPVKKVFRKKDADPPSDPIEAYRQNFINSCYICKRIDQVFERMMTAFFMLWEKNAEFHQTVDACKGFCINHFLMLYERAASHLKPKDCNGFRTLLIEKERENLKRVEDELEWFTLKFDYRYQDQPWKNSRDALPRTILKVNGQFVDKSSSRANP